VAEEEELRLKREKELKEKMAEQEAARENEIIALYKRMADENRAREAEIEELRRRLKEQQEDAREQVDTVVQKEAIKALITGFFCTNVLILNLISNLGG